jgi:hypothetical protein
MYRSISTSPMPSTERFISRYSHRHQLHPHHALSGVEILSLGNRFRRDLIFCCRRFFVPSTSGHVRVKCREYNPFLCLFYLNCVRKLFTNFGCLCVPIIPPTQPKRSSSMDAKCTLFYFHQPIRQVPPSFSLRCLI